MGAGCVLVASFSAMVNTSADSGGGSGLVAHPTIPQVYVPAKPRKQSLLARAMAEARLAKKAKADALLLASTLPGSAALQNPAT